MYIGNKGIRFDHGKKMASHEGERETPEESPEIDPGAEWKRLYFRLFPLIFVGIALLKAFTPHPDPWRLCIASCILALDGLGEYKISDSRVYSSVRAAAKSAFSGPTVIFVQLYFFCRFIHRTTGGFFPDSLGDEVLWNFAFSCLLLGIAWQLVAAGLEARRTGR